MPLNCTKLRRELEFKPKRSAPAIALSIVLLPQLLIALHTSAAEVGKFWPTVAALKKSFEISNPSKVALQIEIKDTTGSPVYLLECHDGNYDSGDFDYSGLIQCRLTSLYSRRRDTGERYNALIYETDPDRDWESRARFLTEELIGKCANYPDWGRVRHFRLRGMDLTLAISDLKFHHVPPAALDAPVSYRFSVQVEPDATSVLSAIEGPSHFAEPLEKNGNAHCVRVVSEHVPGEVTDRSVHRVS